MDSLPELSARKLGTTSITLIDSRTLRSHSLVGPAVLPTDTLGDTGTLHWTPTKFSSFSLFPVSSVSVLWDLKIPTCNSSRTGTLTEEAVPCSLPET